MKIGRTLYWFTDGDEALTTLNDNFFGLGTLLNRLLNEYYDGKKIKFINLEISTEKTYNLYPVVPKNESYYYGGHLQYYGVFDRDEFTDMTFSEQKRFLWNRGLQYLKESAQLMKNMKLLSAAEKAYSKGIEIDLNPDFRVVETDIRLFGRSLKAAVWINFKEDGMYSTFTLEDKSGIIFNRHIDATKLGVGFFLEIYKNIHLEGDYIFIKGHREVEYLPLKIPLEEIQQKINL